MSLALEASPRTIGMRLGVGAAGRIIQRSDRCSQRITVEQPTLVLVEEGLKRISWTRGERVAGAGDALSIQAGEVIDITNTPGPSGSYRALWISWGSEPLAAHVGIGRTESVAVHATPGPQFRAAFERAFEALNDAADLPSAITVSRLQEVLLWLAEWGFRFRSPAPPSIYDQVRRVLSADPAGDWSMEMVARKTASSVATLRRRLAAEGTGFRDVLQDVRMSHALTLLQNTDASVLNVALAVGYDSASRFTARFRSRFGYLPSDIRGQNRQREAPLRDGQVQEIIAAE